MTPQDRERFWAYVVKTETCWLWTGSKNSKGYGRHFLLGQHRYVMAHRASYEELIGPIEASLTLDHYRLNRGERQAECSRACVNPVHLEPVSNRENILRGRSPHAENARKTHCLRGHPFDSINTVRWNRVGQPEKRDCLICTRALKTRLRRAIRARKLQDEILALSPKARDGKEEV